VVVSGVVQDPSTYGVVGNTLTFSTAPPSGTGNISCRYLGVPVTGVTTTAYRTVTEFTATAGQTTFTPPSYSVGFINVYLNGVLLGSADYTASNGTTVVLATGASVGNLVTVESFSISSVANAIPNAAGAVSSSNIVSGVTLTAPNLGTPASGVMTNVTGLPAAQLTGSQAIPKATLPAGCILQVIQTAYTTVDSTSSVLPTMVSTGCSATITPSSSSNKILVMLSMATWHGAASQNAFGRIMRGSSAAFSGVTGDYWSTGGSGISGNINIQWLDSPATTSATTYTAQFSVAGGGTISLNKDYNGLNNGVTYLTLMEIAA
jgi:hypothetical protein